MLDELMEIIRRGSAHAVPEQPKPKRPKYQGIPGEHREIVEWEASELKALCDPVAIVAALKLEELPNMLVLSGPKSSGKSTLGTWLGAREALRMDVLFVWVKAEQLAYMARRQYNLSTQFDNVMRAPIALIDDLGAEWADEQSSGLMRTIIGARHPNRRLRTIVTTGLTKDQRVSRYGEGVAARLTEERRAVNLVFRERPKGGW